MTAKKVKRIIRPRGTRDFKPEEMRKRRFVESQLRKIAELWGYREIETPAFELLELFTVKSGEAVVEEIYSFKDKGGRSLALRPELTAPVARMYVNELQSYPKPLKFYYFGDCFRYERPQSGRYRQFWQFGVELMGSAQPEADVEVIALSQAMLNCVGLEANIHIGYLEVLRGIFCEFDDETCALAMRLIDKGDFKGLKDLPNGNVAIRILQGADPLSEAQTITDISHLLAVLELLDSLGITYTVDFGIARGLEYYTGIVFEAYVECLGAQNQVLGGGSYRLTHLFGGEDVPATGFGIGFDRVMAAVDVEITEPVRVMVIPTEDTRREALKVVNKIRSCISADIDLMRRKMAAQLSYANAQGFDYAIIVGQDEITLGKLTLRDLKTGKQAALTVDEIVDQLAGDRVKAHHVSESYDTRNRRETGT